MADAKKRRNEAELAALQDEIDERVLRLRDLTIFIYAKVISNEDLQKFTKAYAKISNEIDVLENQIFTLKQKAK
ncbi:MAG: hypothetical protein ACRCTP_02365 [Aeromonas popoffii]|uniref:hypothetical protein n=1 Tax=Aeromonas popoffii TaxID=70856 RepID=UPI003F3BC209